MNLWIRIAIGVFGLLLGAAIGFELGRRPTFDRKAVYEQGYQAGSAAP